MHIEYGKVMAEREWYWKEVAFIPSDVAPEDLLRLPGHIFIKSNVVEEMKAKGEFKRKERKKTKKKGRYGRYQKRNIYLV